MYIDGCFLAVLFREQEPYKCLIFFLSNTNLFFYCNKYSLEQNLEQKCINNLLEIKTDLG